MCGNLVHTNQRPLALSTRTQTMQPMFNLLVASGYERCVQRLSQKRVRQIKKRVSYRMRYLRFEVMSHEVVATSAHAQCNPCDLSRDGIGFLVTTRDRIPFHQSIPSVHSIVHSID